MRLRGLNFWRITHYGPRKGSWWIWKPRAQWSRQGAAWCLDLAWLCFFTSTYWNDRR